MQGGKIECSHTLDRLTIYYRSKFEFGAVCQPWYCHICQLRKARKSIKTNTADIADTGLLQWICLCLSLLELVSASRLWYVANIPICPRLWIPKQMTNYKQRKIWRRGGRLKSCHAEWNATKCKKELLAQIGNREVWNRKWTTESADTQGAQSWNAETQGGTKVETQQQHNFHVQLGRKCKSLKLSMYTCWDQVHYWGRIQNQGDHPKVKRQKRL